MLRASQEDGKRTTNMQIDQLLTSTFCKKNRIRLIYATQCVHVYLFVVLICHRLTARCPFKPPRVLQLAVRGDL